MGEPGLHQQVSRGDVCSQGRREALYWVMDVGDERNEQLQHSLTLSYCTEVKHEGTRQRGQLGCRVSNVWVGSRRWGLSSGNYHLWVIGNSGLWVFFNRPAPLEVSWVTGVGKGSKDIVPEIWGNKLFLVYHFWSALDKNNLISSQVPGETPTENQTRLALGSGGGTGTLCHQRRRCQSNISCCWAMPRMRDLLGLFRNNQKELSGHAIMEDL